MINYTDRLDSALRRAAWAHEKSGQHRKGTDIPYIIHPVGVMIIASSVTDDEDALIACLMHDVLEDVDSDVYDKDKMSEEFGERVVAIVLNVTKDETEKDWRKRSEAYLRYLEYDASDEALIVSASDKIHNLLSILVDYSTCGDELWNRFSIKSSEDQLWWYESILAVITRRKVSETLVNKLTVQVNSLKNILNIKGPRILHIVTKKGKGCSFAENDPIKFHGIGAFDALTGEVKVKKVIGMAKSYTEVFGAKIARLGQVHNRIIAITAAMPEGTGLNKFRDCFPERFFDVGIAEGHAVCFAAGLAKQGFKPIVAVYSTFLQRAYDQMLQEISLQKLPVIFALDRAGIVGEDGVTHQGIFDLAYLRTIPHFVIMAPKDGAELEAMLELALELERPVAIRYPRANVNLEENVAVPLRLGKAELISQGKDFTLIALGSMVEPAREAVAKLNAEGVTGNLVNARFAAPLDLELFKNLAAETKLVVTVEEGIRNSGFGSAVAQELNQPVLRLGLPLEFIEHGSREKLLEKYGLTGLGIAASIRRGLKING